MLGAKSAGNNLTIMEQTGAVIIPGVHAIYNHTASIVVIVIIPGVHAIYNHTASIVGIHNTSGLLEHASSFTIEGAGGGYAWVEEYSTVYLLF